MRSYSSKKNENFYLKQDGVVLLNLLNFYCYLGYIMLLPSLLYVQELSFNSGKLLQIKSKCLSIKTFSLSKISISLLVTSP